MLRRNRKNFGQSVMEFAALIIFILAVFIVFQKYIVRGFTGRWKSIGDGLGEGRIYDPKKTIECAASKFFDDWPNPIWYNRTCFEKECEDECLRSTRESGACAGCLTGTCSSPYCD
ncbi:MAG: hypothetical protein JW847_05610 [Candidatus Omnitrophica bacterium]|nr:hypothetical protein [Candidatus Omnitrophota bacterium]